jgi:DGQHR domain-containing protein
MNKDQLGKYINTSYTLDVVPIRGQAFKAITSSIPVSVLVNHYKVDTTEGRSLKDGYQREHNKGRVNSLVNRIINEDVVLPLNITLNIRNENAFSELKGGKFKYVPDVHNNLWVVDGQHRVRALEKAFIQAHVMHEEGDLSGKEQIKKLEEKEIPVVITFTNTRYEEIELFSEINGHQKGVTVDQNMLNDVKRIKMGNTILRDRYEEEGKLKEKFQTPLLVQQINADTDSVWYNKIKHPGSKSDNPNVGSASMCKYFGQIYKVDLLKMIKIENDPKKSKDIFNAYWGGLEEAYPEMFRDPKNYTVQKALGADVFMRMFGLIIAWTKTNNNGDLFKSSTYVPAFKKMIDNMAGTGEDADTGEEIIAQGTDFWKSGKNGAAGNYSNEKGKAILYKIMENALTSDK